MRKILSGSQRETTINRDGCCACCGFIEQGLFATETHSGCFETLCEECLAPRHLESFSQTTFRPAYLPELSGPVVAHFSRVAAWFYFASRMGTAIDTNCGFDGLLPPEISHAKWWENRLVIKSFEAVRADMSGTVGRVRQMRQAAVAYAFFKSRVAATAETYGEMPSKAIEDTVGAEVFRKDFRMIPTAMPISRIRSWGKGSTFSNHPIAEPDKPAADSMLTILSEL